MSVTVTPDPTFSPPRNRIDIAAQSGSIFQTAVLYRLQSGVRTLVRSQPNGGGSTGLTYDYECPYGVPVSYELASTQVTTPGTEWSESWSSTSAWTVTAGTASVSGGNLSLTVNQYNVASLQRPLAGNGGYSVTAASLQLSAALEVDFGSGAASVFLTSATTAQIVVENQVQNVSFPTGTTHAVTITVLGASVVVTVDSTSFSFTRSSTANPNRVVVSRTTTGTWGGAVTAKSYATTSSSYDETSAAATLSPASGWIVHPLTPALSVPVASKADRTAVVLESLGDPVSKSTATVHEILGQSLPIVSTSGSRSSDSLDMVLSTATLAQEAALIGLFRDQTPLLIQFPDAGVGFAAGFYSVGDVTRARVVSNTNEPRRAVSFPLRASQAPQGQVANPGWSWAALAAAYPSWNAVRAAYATWAGVAANIVGS